MKKHYEAMISAENRANQVESAILTLQFADNLLRAREKKENQIAKPFPKICSRLRELLQSAGFETPDSENTRA
jgi:hypothetical protein